MTEAATPLRPGRWQPARIVDIQPGTPRIKRFFLQPEQAFDWLAGQHVDVRLTAEDGYQARRAYSIANAPGSATIELAIERLDDGEVSPFFHEVAQVGDEIELRGPIGGHFVWRPAERVPLLLIGGGSGIVPLAAMLRERTRHSDTDGPAACLVVSARNEADLLYHDEFIDLAASDPRFTYLPTLTRAAAPTRLRQGRIDLTLLQQAFKALGTDVRAYVCGRNAFVENAAQLLLDLNIDAAAIRTERYGG